KQGYFELANGSTLFLDEIADMPLNMQVKLLRVIEEGEIMPVGSSKKKKVKVRILSATNQSIQEMISGHSIRNDLLHRLNTFTMQLQPLRERKEDIDLLFSHYLKFYARKFKKKLPRIDKSVISQLRLYSFPGNVREMKNMIERAMIIIRDDNVLMMVDLYFLPSESGDDIDSDNLNLDYHERKLIEKALKQSNGHRINAAKLLGISRDALKRRIKKYDFEHDE
ncbi:MAG: sigma 54-interacting transcriptional regulator, partial [Candidatus Stygibacter australis]|nr:sigma 54-interacting transcriptional regulator [Candidatus Stygibacter australis]